MPDPREPGSPSVQFTPEVLAAIEAGAVVAFSLSGGKDGTVAAEMVSEELDRLGHPRDRREIVHADLGRAEWRTSAATVEAVGRRLNLPVVTVRHARHDMVSRWQARSDEGRRRYVNLEVFNLIGPWSSSALRFCTAEMKAQVIGRNLAQRHRGRRVISVVGIRRQESRQRATAPVSKPDQRYSRPGADRLTWNPIVDVTTEQVFARHAERGLPLHEAYTKYGASRVSCAFCVLQSAADQSAAIRSADNHELYRSLVRLELDSMFSFQSGRWLANLAPDLLDDGDASKIGAVKYLADERRRIEAALPPGLRYVKGWPVRMPTRAEAADVAGARQQILTMHGLEPRFTQAGEVMDRFAELLAAKEAA